MNAITAERAREMVSYDPTTGALRWEKSPNRRKPVGSPAGSIYGKPARLFINVDGKSYTGGRFIWLLFYGEWPAHVVDHIDGNPLNNRIENLRDVPQAVNAQNHVRPTAKNRSGYLGVCIDRGSKKRPFIASISISKTPVYLGCYATAQEAHEAYVKAKRIHHEGNTL